MHASCLNGRYIYHIKARVYDLHVLRVAMHNIIIIQCHVTDVFYRKYLSVYIYCSPFNWAYTSLCFEFRQEIIYTIQAMQVVTAWVIGGGIDIWRCHVWRLSILLIFTAKIITTSPKRHY